MWRGVWVRGRGSTELLSAVALIALEHGFTNHWSTLSVVMLCSWQGMFYEASSFNGDISSWNVGRVTYMGVRSLQPALVGGIRMCGVDMCVAWCVGAREGKHRASPGRGPHSS